MNVKDLKDYKDNCYTALSRDLTEFEKNFLLVSGGILTFSITFIKDIIKIENARYLTLLFIGWGLIIISIWIMMLAFLKSADASDELWKITDDFIVENALYKNKTELTDDQCNKIKGKIGPLLNDSKLGLKKLRKRAVNFFLLGVFIFASFVCVNLVFEKKLSLNKAESTIKEIHINDTLILKNQKNE